MNACNCIGPQNGQPRCPCMMDTLIQRGGRWIEPERDIGPVRPPALPFSSVLGCICPVGAEKTCRGPFCPRNPLVIT